MVRFEPERTRHDRDTRVFGTRGGHVGGTQVFLCSPMVTKTTQTPPLEVGTQGILKRWGFHGFHWLIGSCKSSNSFRSASGFHEKHPKMFVWDLKTSVWACPKPDSLGAVFLPWGAARKPKTSPAFCTTHSKTLPLWSVPHVCNHLGFCPTMRPYAFVRVF